MFSTPCLAFLDLGFQELFVIMVVALLLFGGRLPEVARSLGRTVGEFKRSANSVTREFRFDDHSFPTRRDLTSVRDKVRELAQDVKESLPDAKRTKKADGSDEAPPSEGEQKEVKPSSVEGVIPRTFARNDPLPEAPSAEDPTEDPTKEEPSSKEG